MATLTAPTAPAPGRVRRAPGVAARRWLPGTVGALCVLLLVELLVRSGLLSDTTFAAPSTVLAELVRQAGTGAFWVSVGHTVQGWLLGLAAATAIAVPLGLVLGSSEYAWRALRPIVEFLRPVPAVALIPVAVLLYGTGLTTTVFLVVVGAVWPVLVQTLYGLRDVDAVALETARVFRLSPRRRLTAVVLPGAVPYIVTGLRISSSIALILAVTAELVVGAPGLGRDVYVAQSAGAVPLTYALIAATGILGLIGNGVFRAAESRVLHWHPSQRLEDPS